MVPIIFNVNQRRIQVAQVDLTAFFFWNRSCQHPLAPVELFGFVPSWGNSQKRSITKLEYRRAKALDKPCLIFLSHEGAPWPITMMDSHTGVASAGKRIKQLRAELADQHVVSFFAIRANMFQSGLPPHSQFRSRLIPSPFWLIRFRKTGRL